MLHRIYVLQTRWAWDNVNSEYCTFTFEKPCRGLEEILLSDAESERRIWMNKIKDVCHAQNGCALGDCKPVRLFVVTNKDGDVSSGEHGRGYHLEKKDMISGALQLTMYLKPVVDFDEDGNPTPFVRR